MRNLLLWLGLGCLLFAPTLLAEDDDAFRLGEVVVSATRQPSRIDTTSAFGSVISQEALQNTTGTTLGDVLGSATGIQMQRYGPGNVVTLSLRGASSEQVLVLVDGERLNDALSGGIDLAQVPLDSVQRIEVIRGGQSALYGADAVGGIINIVTSTPHTSRLNLNSGIGAFGTRQWSFEVKRPWREFQWGLGYGREQSDGNFPYRDLYGDTRTRINADYFRQHGRLLFEWKGSGHLKFVGEHADSLQGVAGPLGQSSQAASQTNLANGLRAIWNHDLGKRLRYQLRAHVRHTSLHYFNPGPIRIDALHKLDSIGFGWQGSWFWKALQHEPTIVESDDTRAPPLMVGFSVRRERATSSALGSPERRTLSVYAQQEWHRHRWKLFPAIRLDVPSDFDAGWSPKLGWRWEPTQGWVLKGNFGRSYRAPTLNDLYWPEDSFTRGNPQLAPERSFDVDVGVRHLMRQGPLKLRTSVDYFYNRYRNRILWSPSNGGKWMPINLDHAIHQGIEAEGELTSRFAQVTLNYTYLDAQDAQGKQLLYKAHHTFHSQARVGTSQLWLSWDTHYQSKRYYTRSNSRWLEPYFTQDLRIGAKRRIGARLSLHVIGEILNLMDVRYQLVKDYPLPGREWRFKTSIQLGGEP